MAIGEVIFSRGWFRCMVLFALLAVGIVLALLPARAEESASSPSPLYQQSPDKSVAEFHDRDQGGGSARLLAGIRADCTDVATGQVLGYQSIAADLGRPLIAPSPAQPNAYCLIQPEATTASSVCSGRQTRDRIANKPIFFTNILLSIRMHPVDGDCCRKGLKYAAV